MLIGIGGPVPKQATRTAVLHRHLARQADDEAYPPPQAPHQPQQEEQEAHPPKAPIRQKHRPNPLGQGRNEPAYESLLQIVLAGTLSDLGEGGSPEKEWQAPALYGEGSKERLFPGPLASSPS